ncbi:hypothetical protein D3C86_1979430 [compost metagenome]
MFFFKNILQIRATQEQTRLQLGKPREICNEPVILVVVRDHHHMPQRAEDVHAVEEVLLINIPVAGFEVMERQL